MSEPGVIEIACKGPCGEFREPVFSTVIEGGLAVHEKDWMATVWTVTHVKSGRIVASGYSSKGSAVRGMHRLLKAGDWTRTMTAVKRDKACRAAALAEREKVKK